MLTNLINLTFSRRRKSLWVFCYKRYQQIKPDGSPMPLKVMEQSFTSYRQQQTCQSDSNKIPQLSIFSDLKIIFDRDPAAKNWLEILLCYPGVHALILHRLANWLWQKQLPLLPRLLSQISRFITGIEIHPGASIGRGVFIDHGMGVVIGETAIVGDYCLIYQNVTLGGTGKQTGKRHPTLGQNVVVGAGAKILGNIQLGDYVRVGAGSIVLRDVPDNCTVVGVPGRIVSRNGYGCPLEHGKLPDPEVKTIRSLLGRIERLEQQIQTLSRYQSQNHESIHSP